MRRNRNVQREVEARGEWKEESNAPRLHEVGFVNNAQGDVRWADVMVCVHPFLNFFFLFDFWL